MILFKLFYLPSILFPLLQLANSSTPLKAQFIWPLPGTITPEDYIVAPLVSVIPGAVNTALSIIWCFMAFQKIFTRGPEDPIRQVPL